MSGARHARVACITRYEAEQPAEHAAEGGDAAPEAKQLERIRRQPLRVVDDHVEDVRADEARARSPSRAASTRCRRSMPWRGARRITIWNCDDDRRGRPARERLEPVEAEVEGGVLDVGQARAPETSARRRSAGCARPRRRERPGLAGRGVVHRTRSRPALRLLAQAPAVQPQQAGHHHDQLRTDAAGGRVRAPGPACTPASRRCRPCPRAASR